MHRLVHIVSSFAVAVSTCAIADARDCSNDSPLVAGAALYTLHYNFIHEGSGSPPLSEPLRTLVAANIEQNLQADDVGAVDWDFWTDAQDGAPSPNVKAVLANRRGTRAVVRLHYHFHLAPESPPRLKVADVYLIRSGSGCWLVDDLRRNGKSLSSILQRGTR